MDMAQGKENLEPLRRLWRITKSPMIGLAYVRRRMACR